VRKGSKYQLSLRTSNLPGLVSTGKMIANEGGAITCKFINGVEASTVMQWIVNPPVLTTPGSIPGYSTRIPAAPVVIHRACTNSTIKLGVLTIYLRVPMEGAWRNRRVLLISPIENNQTDRVTTPVGARGT
jgi:hypothetical protein